MISGTLRRRILKPYTNRLPATDKAYFEPYLVYGVYMGHDWVHNSWCSHIVNLMPRLSRLSRRSRLPRDMMGQCLYYLWIAIHAHEVKLGIDFRRIYLGRLFGIIESKRGWGGLYWEAVFIVWISCRVCLACLVSAETTTITHYPRMFFTLLHLPLPLPLYVTQYHFSEVLDFFWSFPMQVYRATGLNHSENTVYLSKGKGKSKE